MRTFQPVQPSRQGVETNVPAASPAALKGMAALVPSTAVLRGHKSVSIEHEGVIYRLQVTKLGKLILTK